MDSLGYNFLHRRLTWSGFRGEGSGMTATGQTCLMTRDALRRRASGFAPFGYWYGYFTAGAETV